MSRLFIFVLLIASFLSAQDEYELKDGTIIKGTVISETADETQIETESGEIIIIKVKEDRVGGVYNIELDSGKSIIGQIVFEDTKLIKLDVIGSEPVKLYWENIRNITKAENEDDGTGRIIDNPDQLVINHRRQEAEDCGNASDDYVDYDGNVYKTVQIGEQVWMAENLRVTHYNDGEPIHTRMSLGNQARWGGVPVGMYSDLGDFYLEDEHSEMQADAFGKNYNWYAVDSGKLANEGWRVPSDEDWMELEAFIGMSSVELDDYGWRGTNQGAKLAGMAGMWGGMNCSNCEYILVNDPEFSTTCLNLNPSRATWLTDDLYPRYNNTGDSHATYWTSTNMGPHTTYQPVERTVDRAINRHIYFARGSIERIWTDKYHGLQVRLIKDE
jgi:uncharacterized protein (TIGR02145 family)